MNYITIYINATITILVFSLLTTLSLSAQQNKIAFEKYGVAEGLPEEYVGSVLQDDLGFIWCATQNGLVKFDGYQFQIYRYFPDDTNSTSLKIRNLLGGLIKGMDGKLWMGAYRDGVSSFDPQTEVFNNFLHNPNDPNDPESLPFDVNRMLFEDLSGNIWFENRFPENDTAIICRIDPNSNKIYRYPHQVDGLFYFKNLGIQVFEISADSSIWLLEENGNLRRWNNSNDIFEIITQHGSTLPGTEIIDSLETISPCGNNLYLTSKYGLYIWDPIKNEVIQSFKNNTEDLNSIFKTQINYAFRDMTGCTWVMHDEGKISIINKERNNIIRYQYGISPLDFGPYSENINITHTFQDQDGIWFQKLLSGQSTSFLYYKFSNESFTAYDSRFNYKHNEISVSNRKRYYNFSVDRTGLLWLNTRPNLYKQSPKSIQIDLFRKNQMDLFSLPSDTILNLFEDSQERLWIGTQNGLAMFIEGQKKLTIFKHNPLQLNTISNNWIQSVFEDSDGKIWVATRNGLNILNESTLSFKRIFYGVKETNDFFANLIEDHQGRVWSSIWNKGVFVLDRKSGNPLKIHLPTDHELNGLTSSQFRTIFQDSRNYIWIADSRDTENALFRYNETENHFYHYYFNSEDINSISSNEILYLAEDKANRLWIGTDGGLNQYNYEFDNFTRYPEKYIPSTSSCGFDPNGDIWVSTYSGNGLVNINPETGEIKVYGENEGLLHNDVSQSNDLFILDDFGNFWLPNQRGVSVFNPINKRFTNYTIKDGFQQYSRFYSTIKTANGEIWIGGQNGLNRIRPNLLLQKDSIVPQVLITTLNIMGTKYSTPDGKIFQKAVSFTEEINLSHEQKDLTFEFVGLHFLRSEDNLYSWKLENYDKDWSAPSKERKAGYTNLPPGSYTFHIRASNADGIWNEEGARLKIDIAPPWWQTTLAYIIYGLIFIIGVIVIDRTQRKRLKERAKSKAREKELKQAKEIKKAYDKLKTTQTQLIHSEKMASLGELTAGIAHEIQNPLNFVNNFSEVNAELISELNEEIEKGDLEEVKAISKDIAENEQKIIHHGKRADSIVKGMLQHSRTASKEKELTEINTLADEFLRLSYHGLRAKDKSFNADFKTDLDEDLPKVKIVPQDIGRVLLNLVNNAFYAVDQKSKNFKNGYKPMITVITKKEESNVKIIVTDNGNGIPDEVIDKIFQPFFTTKSTGVGTGLGLSLSYDIITKGHDGELKVETKEGEGTSFIITLPLN